jgi:hypothetical protein
MYKIKLEKVVFIGKNYQPPCRECRIMVVDMQSKDRVYLN